MASTYTSRLRIEKQGTGENSNTWGTRLNTNVIDMIDEAIAGSIVVSVSSATVSLTANNAATDQHRPHIMLLSGVLTSSIDVVVPSLTKSWIVRNGSSGSFSITVKAAGGSGYAVPQGETRVVWCDGTSVRTLSESSYITQTSASQLYVQLSAADTITGAKTFTSAVSFAGSVANSGALTQTGAAVFTGAVCVTSVSDFGKAVRGALVTLTYAASVSIDFSLGNDFLVSMGGSITFATPSNVKVGQSGVIYISQVSGAHTGAWATEFNFPASTAPTLSTAASATDMIPYNVRSSTAIDCGSALAMG